MLAGMWRQHELGDGTYDFLDLVLINRVLDIKDENHARFEEAMRERSRQR